MDLDIKFFEILFLCHGFKFKANELSYLITFNKYDSKRSTNSILTNIDVSLKKSLQRKDFAETNEKTPNPSSKHLSFLEIIRVFITG